MKFLFSNSRSVRNILVGFGKSPLPSVRLGSPLSHQHRKVKFKKGPFFKKNKLPKDWFMGQGYNKASYLSNLLC